MKIRLDRKKVVRLLIGIAIVLVILSILVNISTFVFDHGFLYGFVPEFNLDKEANIPTIFSSLLLLGGAALFYLNGRLVKEENRKNYHKFMVLTGIFTFFSIDEISSLHELLINPIRATGFTGAFHFAWVVVYIPIVIFLAFYFLRFFFSLSRELQIGLFLAAFFYVGGALGVELYGGTVACDCGESTLKYGLVTTLEETMEIIGMIILWNTLLKPLGRSEKTDITISFQD